MAVAVGYHSYTKTDVGQLSPSPKKSLLEAAGAAWVGHNDSGKEISVWQNCGGHRQRKLTTATHMSLVLS